MAEQIKRYKGRYTGPQIDDLLGRVPTVEQRVTSLEDGGGDKHRVVVCEQPKSVHEIVHNLGKEPAVTIVDYYSREEIVGDVKHLSENALQVGFTENITCIVYLN